ncbi:hypothetical protein BY458DRAFT_527075 [Sporodiniella umbellata]|nr:hypothetical protein BY458DRAFT_527075 [Sporodiniella umbellata]
MSIGPHRPSFGFSTIPSTPNSLPRQHMMNTPTFQQVMTLVPSPNASINTPNSSHTNNSSSGNSVPTSRQNGPGGATQTMYCDNCQTFRHISFFQDKSYKYSVCRLCDEREIQKRMVNKERYEQYEEQQKNLKQTRYPMPQCSFPQTSQAPPPVFSGVANTSTSPVPQAPSAQLSIQLPQMPITLGGNHSPANLPPPSNLAAPTNNSNNNSHLSPQMNTSSGMILGMNINGNKQPLFSTPANKTTASAGNASSNTTSTNNNHTIRNDSLPMHPPSNPATLRMRSANRTSSSSHVDLISLGEFVEELKKQVDFDRKLFHLDIQPLIEVMGPLAGFSQLGRGICEKVLEGTRFNFSLKDRRKSTKSPETLSTLRYYCSQRSDTAKPRKAEHPKAQLKYDCAGALTIIIDLSKKSANVTVIHKHTHPPFISHHQPKSNTSLNSQRVRSQDPPHTRYLPSQPDTQQRKRMLLQQKQQQTHQRFDALKHQLGELGMLIESQRHFGNESFLDTATQVLSEANEMVQACKAAEHADTTCLPNKYTLHYNKRGDHSL